MTDRAPACPAAPLWRGSASLGLSSSALPDRADAAPAADRGLSPSSQYGSSLVGGKVRVLRDCREAAQEGRPYSNLIPARLMTSPRPISANPRQSALQTLQAFRRPAHRQCWPGIG